METIESLIGTELQTVSVDSNICEIIFLDRIKNCRYELKFHGIIIKTKQFSENHQVETISSSILGFQAHTEVLFHRWNLNEYKQLFIKLKVQQLGIKVELIAAYKDLYITKLPY